MRKKNFIGLSILLLVFLLGLSTTSYADVYRDFTKSDLQNLIYNSGISIGKTQQVMEDTISQIDETSLTNIATNMNNYNYVIIAVDKTKIQIRCGNENYTTGSGKTTYITQGDKQFVNNNNIYSYGVNIFYTGNFIGSINNDSGRTINLLKYDNINYTNYYYSSYNVYRTSSGGNSLGNTPLYAPNSDIFDGNYSPPQTYFDFTYNDNLQTIYIDSFGNTPIRVLDFSHGNCYIGYVSQREYLKGVSLVRFIYSTISNSWVILDQNNADILLSKEVEDDKYKLYVNTNINNLHGSIYMVSLISNSSDFENIRTYFYIKTKNDYFNNSGGLISPIFSGDPNYEDQNKHADTVDKIKDVNDTLTDDSTVDSQLDEFFSGDNLISSIGYSPLENPFTSVIIDVTTRITDAVLGSGNVTLSLGMFGTLHSEDFVLPDGVIKTFITLISNGFLIFAIYKYGFKLYNWINSGRLQNLVNESTQHQYYLF